MNYVGLVLMQYNNFKNCQLFYLIIIKYDFSFNSIKLACK